MKLTNNKKIALVTMATTMMSTVVNASTSSNESLSHGLGTWITIVAGILTVTFIVFFAAYLGKFLSVKSNKSGESDAKVVSGVRNGVMTTLIGVAICQAAIIVAQLYF